MIFYILLIVVSICLGVLLFKHKHSKHNVTGEFLVSGKGNLVINLCHPHRPKDIDIHFDEYTECHPCHPCNPHHDKLNWQLLKKRGYFQLILHYDVGSVRGIDYKIKY